jgi:tRNA A-37 threonylcarbamoyl transferase component Bud32
VNWQRHVRRGEYEGRKVVIKTNKRIKGFRDFILVFTYVLTSVLILHPSSPHPLGAMLLQNESTVMRGMLRKLEILSPTLLYISKKVLIEEFIEGGNLYSLFEKKADPSLASKAGILTGRLHNSNLVFLDNKAENYLLNSNGQLVRTDLSLIMRDDSVFSRSMDIACFLASIMDLGVSEYRVIHDTFIYAYEGEVGRPCPYLYIILRNILALGFSSNRTNTFMNLLKS